MEQITDEQKIAVDRTLLKIAGFIESRKMDLVCSCLTKDATIGFNLACDFLAHELRKIRELSDWQKETSSYEVGYVVHK